MLQSATTQSTTLSDLDQKFWDYFDIESCQPTNSTERVDVTVPAIEQGFVVGMYSALLVIGAVGNVAVFSSLVRSRRRKSRVNLLMTHLVVADMIVTFIVIPLEIGWKTTNAWLAGNVACKIFMVLRAFGLYLSSNVLVCISIDRFFAVVYPLRLPIARKRSKLMLYVAWIIALICSLPQSIVFRVLHPPNLPEFQQCVSFEAFPRPQHEVAYNIFCLCAVYLMPLFVITGCYACIFYEIAKNSKEINNKSPQNDHSRIHLRRSDERPLARARRRTLRMTVTIVSVFALCWLPYAIMALWYMLDRKSAVQVSEVVQEMFFMMAVSNSCMDPLVYGSYALDLRSYFTRLIKRLFCMSSSPIEMPEISGTSTFKRKMVASDVVHPHNHAPIKHAYRRVVRFEETTLAGPSASSEPLPTWKDREMDSVTRIKSSHSCEIFTIQVTPVIHNFN